MNTPALFALALLVPVLLAASLLIPPYLGMYGAAYMIYMPESGAHPLAERLLDVFYILDVYQHLLRYWLGHIGELGIISHALPIAVLPLACALFSLWATSKLSRKLLNVFHDFTGSGQ